MTARHFKKDGSCEVDVSMKRETEKAYLLDVGGKEAVWVAKSQIQDETRDANTGKLIAIVLPEWLAAEKGMI